MHPNYEPHWTNYLNQFDLSNEYFQSIKGVNETDKFCVIVEPRQSTLLPLVIKNFMYLLQSKNWGLIVFHGITNENYIKTALTGWNNVVYINMNVSNLTIEQYNNLYCSELFWQKLKDAGCNKCLSFEIDTLLFNDNVDDFIEFDYVGAPWCIKWMGMLEIGNSGLSMRNVDKMLEIVKHCPRHTIDNRYMLINNDIYFSYWCIMKNVKIPSIEEARKFSVETIYYENPCGTHKPHIDKFPNGYDDYIKLLSKRVDIKLYS
jgi:hypothetical protein